MSVSNSSKGKRRKIEQDEDVAAAPSLNSKRMETRDDKEESQGTEVAMTKEDILRRFLCEARLFDVVPFEEFVTFVPSKFKKHPQLVKFHRTITRKRNKIKAGVERNITNYTKSQRDGAVNTGIDIAIGNLKEQARCFSASIDQMQSQMDSLFGDVVSFVAKLDPSSLKTAESLAAKNMASSSSQ